MNGFCRISRIAVMALLVIFSTAVAAEEAGKKKSDVEVDTVDVPEQILIQPPRQKSMRKVLIGPAMHATTPAIRKLSIGP